LTEKKLTLNESLCKGCHYCIEFCPNKVLAKSWKVNEKGAELPEIKNPEKCTKCGFCVLICPDFALELKEEDEDEDKGT
jgi:2-oxoglutarate ferredoxin oxidoreductase subunit delta